VPPSSTSSSWATGTRSGRASYSPEDWERLVELKDRYDPNNLFRFNRNILPSSVLE
jgi:FAD/FMN-containing dehydrogenase